MGSYSIEEFYKSATATMQEAYADLVAQATYEHGNDPYNGSINTTEGCVSGGDPRRLYTQAEADAIIAERLDTLHKWGPVEGLRVMDLNDAPRRTVRVKVTLRESPSEFRDWVSEVATTARDQVKPRAGEEVEHVKILRENGKDLVNRKYKISVEATREKSETRYFIESGNRNDRHDWDRGHPTQAAAREALVTYLNGLEDNGYSYSTIDRWAIVAETRRESGNPLVTATRKVVGITAEVEVVLYTVPKNPRQGGWVFYGWAAS